MIHFEKKEKYVLISGEGERKGLLTIQESTKKMYEFVVESQCRLALIDYRNVNFNISNTDAFNAVRFFETKFPLLITISVAVVLNNANMALGKTWTDLGTARGFNFKIFQDVLEAETWLLQQ
jgi:hypothetical protein